MTDPVINRCEFRGYLGKDPVFDATPGAAEVAYISLATNPSDVPDGTGGWFKRKPDWLAIVVFKPQAIVALRRLKKGDGVHVIASAGQREGKPDSGDGSVRPELVLAVNNRYSGQGVWSWCPKTSRERIEQ